MLSALINGVEDLNEDRYKDAEIGHRAEDVSKGD